MSAKQWLGALVFYGRFAPSFTAIGYRIRRLRWPRLTTDFRGQRWLVTGASGGLGAAVAEAAAAAGAEVLAAARNETKLAALPSGITRRVCDFSLLAEVDRFVDECASAGRRFDVLVNNVGVLATRHALTVEGHETSYVTNLLSHYALTEGLIARGVLGGSPRRSLVINVSSGGAYTVPLSVASLDIRSSGLFNGTAAYAYHKRAQIVLGAHWQRRHGAAGVDVHVMHPGWVDTAGVQGSLPTFRRWWWPLLRDAHAGVDTILWLAAARPVPVTEEAMWFDRALRPAHVFSLTQQSSDTPEALVRHLEQDRRR